MFTEFNFSKNPSESKISYWKVNSRMKQSEEQHWSFWLSVLDLKKEDMVIFLKVSTEVFSQHTLEKQ